MTELLEIYTEDQVYQLEQLKKLRAPFEAHQIKLLPKPFKKDAQKGKCDVCGGYHGLPAAHLEYVGHAALTDRLLDVDPFWDWQPLALDSEGLPKLDSVGGMWIKLTLCGMTRLGYGDAEGKTGGNAAKERIGDALRNAGMRFGAALELWHKGVLHMDSDEDLDQTKKDAIVKQPISGKRFEAAIEKVKSKEYPAAKVREHFELTIDQETHLTDAELGLA